MDERAPFHEILLLDDDEDDYVLLKAMIHACYGTAVHLDWYQKDGVATEMICSGVYAVSLVDYRLGKENGLDVIRRAKAQCSDHVVFLFTAWDQDDIEERSKRSGANGVLQKNRLSAEMLKAALKPYLDSTQQGG